MRLNHLLPESVSMGHDSATRPGLLSPGGWMLNCNGKSKSVKCVYSVFSGPRLFSSWELGLARGFPVPMEVHFKIFNLSIFSVI